MVSSYKERELAETVAQACRVLGAYDMTHAALGHVSVRLASDGAEAVITGDLMHHPVQVAEPGWQSSFDTDPTRARETRRAFCARYADRPVAVLGTHFHHPTAGWIVSDRNGWRFSVDARR